MSDPGHVLKTEPTRLSNGLDLGGEKKTRVMGNFQVSGQGNHRAWSGTDGWGYSGRDQV